MNKPRFLDREAVIFIKDLKTSSKNKNGGEFGLEKNNDQESIQNYTISFGFI